MDSMEEYVRIILNRLQNPLPKDEYGEKHHILPKSCGGMDLKSNLVRLTPEEHYECHKLLIQVFKELGNELGYQKMLYAWALMSDHEPDKSSEDYGKLKRAYAKQVSADRKGKSSWLKGKALPKSVCSKISSTLNGHSVSDESKEKNRQKHIGKCHTEETKRRIAAKMKNRKVADSTKKKLSNMRKGKGNPMYGKVPWNKGKRIK